MDEKQTSNIIPGLEGILSDMNKEQQQILVKQLKAPAPPTCNQYEHYHRPRRAKIGIISDTHIGSKYFDPATFEKSVHIFNREKVEAIYHAGDIIEGMSNRDGHIYELETIGVTAQIDQAADLLNQYKQPLFFITGNHDGWSSVKANQGVDIGGILEDKIAGATNLGAYETNIKLAPAVTMRMTHDGSSAYALSYSMQKRINSMDDKSKPDILANGHIHKALYLNYRGIHGVESATMQQQTPFMARKGSPAMVGFWIFDIKYTKKGVSSFAPTFYPSETHNI